MIYNEFEYLSQTTSPTSFIWVSIILLFPWITSNIENIGTWEEFVSSTMYFPSFLDSMIQITVVNTSFVQKISYIFWEYWDLDTTNRDNFCSTDLLWILKRYSLYKDTFTDSQ